METNQPKILFYPNNVRKGGKVWAYCKWLGIENVTKAYKEGILAAFFTHPNPDCLYPKDKEIIKISKQFKVFNLDFNNAQKDYIYKVHKEIFGYNADIPEDYEGKIVRKSIFQYRKKETFVNKVIPVKNFTHMKFINTYKDGYHVDMRVPYFDGDIPIVVLKKKLTPFERKVEIESVEVKKCFSSEEIFLIKEFCREINLDYGELDVLRDNKDGMIYVIDVNDKPALGFLQRSEYLREIFTQSFKKMIMKYHKNKELNNNYYDKVYTSNKENKGQYTLDPENSMYYPVWSEALKYIRKKKYKVADLGCGPGQFAKLLLNRGYMFMYGVDFSYKAIDMAKEMNPEYKDKFYNKNLLDPSAYNIDKYKVATCFEVLEHIEKDTNVISFIPSDTIFIFSVPNYWAKGHVRVFNNEEEIIDRYASLLDFVKIIPIPMDRKGKIIYLAITVRK